MTIYTYKETIQQMAALYTSHLANQAGEGISWFDEMYFTVHAKFNRMVTDKFTHEDLLKIQDFDTPLFLKTFEEICGIPDINDAAQVATKENSNIDIECLPEDKDIESCYDTGDVLQDKAIIDTIREELGSGNDWAWFTAKITVKFKEYSHTEYLGCCSYKSRFDFTADGGYYSDMVKECLQEINKQIISDVESKDVIKLVSTSTVIPIIPQNILESMVNTFEYLTVDISNLSSKEWIIPALKSHMKSLMSDVSEKYIDAFVPTQFKS